MAMSIVESTRPVTGGVDTHLDEHVAAALDARGAVLGVESFPATALGYRQLHAWLGGFGEIEAVGVEGTGSCGIGLARFLHQASVRVIEVDRPNRQVRRRQGKSDPLDAVEAARAALSGRATGVAKTADGPMEAIRVLLVAKRSARAARTKALTQIRHLGFCAPDALRDQLRDVPVAALAGRVATLRPRPEGDVVVHGTKVALQTLGRRVLALDEELDRLDVLLEGLVVAAAPQLLDLHGVGSDTAATLLVAAGDNPERLRSEAAWANLCGVAPLQASSGRVTRHRLNRGGNRQANHALWRIVITRMSSDSRTRVYVARRLNEGLSKPEIIRVLKRYVAREIWRHLPR
jgi:transposase